MAEIRENDGRSAAGYLDLKEIPETIAAFAKLLATADNPTSVVNSVSAAHRAGGFVRTCSAAIADFASAGQCGGASSLCGDEGFRSATRGD
jgi:hypothetical protein